MKEEEEEEEGMREEFPTVPDSCTHRMCVRVLCVCVHMVYDRDQNRAASRPADLHWERGEESDQQETDKA